MVARPIASRKPAGRQGSKPSSKSSSSFVLILIGAFKLLKALLLIAEVQIGAIKFLHKDVASTAMHWVEILRVDPDNRVVHADSSSDSPRDAGSS